MNPETRFREARPTQYNGVLFRSKSEAIVARALDLLVVVKWHYEPPGLKQADGWVPDFIIHYPVPDGSNQSITFEYKPAQPTPAYVSELWKRFQFAHDRGWACGLMIGSPFQLVGPRVFYFRTPNGWILGRNVGWLFSHWGTARRHRFDLLNWPPA